MTPAKVEELVGALGVAGEEAKKMVSGLSGSPGQPRSTTTTPCPKG